MWSILLGCLGVAAGVFVVWGSISWVLTPLERAAKHRLYAVQFTLADFLCLFVLVQLPLGVVHWAAHNSAQREAVLGLDLLAAGIAVVAWFACVQMLSAAGIHVVWQRSVALAVVMPITIFGNFAAILMPVAAVAMLTDGRFSAACWLLVAEVVLGCVFYGLGRFTRAIVAAVESPTEQQPTNKE
jgi:hypothetical protein